MLDLGVLYRYQWGGQRRALHTHLLDTTATVREVDPVSCEPIEEVGVYTFDGTQLIGDAPLAETRRAAIVALLQPAVVVAE
jgi:hypothetical protein